MPKRRVVITGLGVLSPIGNGVAAYWDALIKGVSGAAPITYFDAGKFKTKFACELKKFDPLNYIDKKEARKMDLFCQYALIASDEAVADSGLNLEKIDKSRVGVILGSGVGGIKTFQDSAIEFGLGNGIPRFNPFFIPKMIVDIAPGIVSIKYGFRGPNFGTVSACTSAGNAIIDAYNYISMDYADAVVSGGSEAAITEVGIGGFNALHALSTRNESPETASRPFDKTRDGFVLGEGAGVLLLEEYNHAIARNARIYAEIIGAGLSADAYHMTAPHPEGIGVKAVMKNCLNNAKISYKEVDSINTHGTSTPLGDIAELKAITEVFSDHAKNININSTKSMTGHLLGASGAIESIASVLSIVNNKVPPTINHSVVDEEINPELNLTLNKAQDREVNVVMSNTFGFGGHNACLLFKKVQS